MKHKPLSPRMRNLLRMLQQFDALTIPAMTRLSREYERHAPDRGTLNACRQRGLVVVLPIGLADCPFVRVVLLTVAGHDALRGAK